MITLFIGRFQPFHNGHLQDIKKAVEFSNKIIIGIGSAKQKNTTDNPFSYEERKEMIMSVLEKEKIQNCEILPIPDINNDEEWVNHVISITGNIDITYTGNNWVKRLFKKKYYEVREVTILKDVNATEIRKRIAQNKDWESLVPIQIAHYMRKIEGVNRIKEINGIL